MAVPLICGHCSRSNSPDAYYCWYDGASLMGSGAEALAVQTNFLTPFVFPSGQSCRDFDEFALGCQDQWEFAVDLLQSGFFQQFFSNMGRLDLARFAQESASFPDRERGLDQFLSRLPIKSVPPAKLAVKPETLNLGTLQVGQEGHVELTLENKGGRLLFGTLAASVPWISVSEAGEQKLFQFRSSVTLKIGIKGLHLRAGMKPIEGDIFIDSNAGSIKVPVLATVPIQPFPEGVLAGSLSPREIAEKARKHPREAAAFFASGLVHQWYAWNGWVYPVEGPPSNGLAAVQQFFEALGLAKAPKVYCTEQQIDVKGAPGTVLKRTLQVRSDESRPVFAHATTTASWLAVKPGIVQGNVVTLPLEITVPGVKGSTERGLLRIVSNGNQRFDVPIQVTAGSTGVVGAPAAGVKRRSKADIELVQPAGAIQQPGALSRSNPDLATPPPPIELTPVAFDPIGLVLHLVPLLVLAFVLLGLLARDVLSDAARRAALIVNEDGPEEAHAKKKSGEFKFVIQDEPDEQPNGVPTARHKIEDEPEERIGGAKNAPVEVKFTDEPPEFAPGKGGGGKAVPVDPTERIRYTPNRLTWGLTDAITRKRLTYSSAGTTNRTVMRVNGIPQFAGGIARVVNLPDDPAREARRRTAFTVFPRPGLKVTQFLEIVPSQQPVDVGGQQRRLLDTLLVRYVYENTGDAAVNAGLRLEVDTLIGNNDGVPFTVPGLGLVNTSAQFLQPKEVPDFVQALEFGNLRNPGTIVHITLKVGGQVEAPSQVTLCHWKSNGDLSFIRPTNMGTDSAIVMVWPDQNLPAGGKREMGYAYGLGAVTVADPGGSLAMTVGGNFDIGQSFTITAYVNRPAVGQTLTLELPPGLDRVKGEARQDVPAANANGTSIVSWEAKVLQTGVFPVKVRSSTGVTQTKTITIARGDGPTGGAFQLDLQGRFEPGEVFTVVGKVSEPVANQTLTLDLPPGLQRVEGAERQPVPIPAFGSKESLVNWKVRVIRPDKYRVRVVSSTGVARVKTVTIEQGGRAEGAFKIFLSGDFAPGKTFTVSTTVVTPTPDQKLTLTLPEGLERVAGDETQDAQASKQLTWSVKVKQLGKFTVGVRSTTGVTQRKTVVIETPTDQPGRFVFDLNGDIRPGKEFEVKATVTSPANGQTLNLVLPTGLSLVSANAKQDVPAAPPGGQAIVTWQVRVTQSGRLPVRIESSTGLARTKTITLSQSANTLFGGN